MLMASFFCFFGVEMNIQNYAAANEGVDRHRTYNKTSFEATGTVLDIRTNIPQYSRNPVTHSPVFEIKTANGQLLNYRTELTISSIYPRSELLPSWEGRKVALECSQVLNSCRSKGSVQSDANVFWQGFSFFIAGMFGLLALIGALCILVGFRRFKSYVLSGE